LAAVDRKARIALIAALAGIGLIAWFVVRRDGDKPAAAPTAAAPGADPVMSGGPVDPTGKLRRPAPTPLRVRVPGPPVQVTGTVRLALSGTPVAGAEVAFMNETGETTATTDGSGQYTLKVASGVRWKVHARTDNAVGYPEAFQATGPTAVRVSRSARSARSAAGWSTPGARRWPAPLSTSRSTAAIAT
jgi:hypothetical protein